MAATHIFFARKLLSSKIRFISSSPVLQSVKKPKAKGKKDDPKKDKSGIPRKEFDDQGRKIIPVNVFKDKEDPVELTDDQYPEWLFSVLQPDRDLLYFRRNDIRKIPLDEIKRYVKLYNRGKIKENNEYSKK